MSHGEKTLHFFQYNGKGSMTVSAAREDFSIVKDWEMEIFSSLNIPDKEIKQLIISSDEIFSNIAMYSYPPEEKHPDVEITLALDPAANSIVISFADHGIEFNPLASEAVLPRERVQNHIPGGLGLFLVHQFTDKLTYRRENGCNILTMEKAIHPPDK